MSRQKHRRKKKPFTPGIMAARTNNNKQKLSFAESIVRIEELAQQFREKNTSKILFDIDHYVAKVSDIQVESIQLDDKLSFYKDYLINSYVPGFLGYGEPVHTFPDLAVGFEKRFLDTIQITECRNLPAKSVFQTSESVTAINERLRVLWTQFRESKSTAVLLEIKALVSKLHSLLSKHFRSAQKNLKGLIKSILISLRINKIRACRFVMTAMFKCFNDFSGSEEEEAVAYNLVGNKFFNLQLYDNVRCRDIRNIRFSYIFNGK